MIVPEDQREDHRQAFGAFMGSGETGVRHRELELTAMHKDGHTLPVELSTVAWRAADGVYVTGILRDLTRRKRAEEERRKLDEKVQQVQKMESLGVLAGGIAHDFNNLLVSILGNADLALMDLPRESPARECIQDIRTASQRAADLSRQILAYSGKGRFVVEPLDLNMLIEELTHLLEATLAKDALLRLHLADPLPLVEGDATQLRQVIMNLITNASDSVGKRSGVITITTGTMECDRPYLSEAFLDEDLPEGRYTWLEVSDTGEGMDAATRERIFDPFFTTKSTGRGLGLAAVLGIVRGHRGAIHVYSEPGDGTTFKLLFPVHQECAGLAPIAPEPVVDFRGSGAVLVVDDEDTVHAVTRRMLHRMGFEEILAARDGREALTLFDQRRDDICCILLDLTMPHMDGAATFRELRRLGAGIPVILVSGYNEQDVVNRFAGKGLAGFLQKPFEYSMLARKVQEAIDWSPRGAVDG